MKALYKDKIGEYNIVLFITDVPIDTEATNVKIEPMKKPGMTKEEIDRLFMDNLQPSKFGPEADIVEDSVAIKIQRKLDARGENCLLLVGGDYIADYRGAEYWIKESGKWEKERIEDVGIGLPVGAVLQENLSKEQQEEIFGQQEAERIAGLSPEEKAKEKSSRLHAIARETIMKAEEAELLGEMFDKQVWLQSEKVEIEKLYM